MSLKSFVVAVEADIEKVFHTIEGTPAVQQIEVIAIDAVASEIEAVAQKFLGAGTPIDNAVNALIKQLAAKVVAALPTATPVKSAA